MPSYGPPNARVVIVGYSDFECPPCKIFAEVRKKLKTDFDGKILWIYKPFFSTERKWGLDASYAALCVNEQKSSSFWAFHDLLFEQQRALTAEQLHPLLYRFAREQQLDAHKIDRCISEHQRGNSPVAATALEAKRMNVFGTPTVFVNGRRALRPTDEAYMRTLIEQELDQTTPGRKEE